MKILNDKHSNGHPCAGIIHTQCLSTHTYSKSRNSLLIITLSKVTEFRKRAVMEEKVSIEVPKQEPHPAKGILCFD